MTAPVGPGYWLVAGTVPDPDFPLYCGPCLMRDGQLHFGDETTPVNRGTPALCAAALVALNWAQKRGKAADRSFLCLAAGDTGRGNGSRAVYEALTTLLPRLRPVGLTFHYLLPDVDWHNRILMVIEALPERPFLAADAGYMYVAKMSGYAGEYDLFTPDIGELAFLADPEAPHPFYTRNFLLADEGRAEELIAAAYANDNAAKHMLVKGVTDRLVREGNILAEVSEPDVPMLEPLGGTGDTLTGIVTALLIAGMSVETACLLAMRANRLMGEMACPDPASSVADLLGSLPGALDEA